MTRLEESRREAEAALADLRAAVGRELGPFAPRRKWWWGLLAAAAVGVALGAGRVAARRQKRLPM